MKLIRRFLRFFRPIRFKCDPGAVIYDSAQIINNLVDVSAISIGSNSHIRGKLLTFEHGGRITIGEYCYVGEHCNIWSALNITIGDNVLIGHNVSIFDSLTHPISVSARHKQFEGIITGKQAGGLNLDEREVIINKSVWIGCMSVILRGVTVGEGAIIGAGSVVTKDIPPYSIVAGNPAKIIREIPIDER